MPQPRLRFVAIALFYYFIGNVGDNYLISIRREKLQNV